MLVFRKSKIWSREMTWKCSAKLFPAFR